MIKHSASPRGGGVPPGSRAMPLFRGRAILWGRTDRGVGQTRAHRPIESNSFAVAAILMIPAALSAQVGGVRAKTMPSEPSCHDFAGCGELMSFGVRELTCDWKSVSPIESSATHLRTW
jgi:hypothetical protein